MEATGPLLLEVKPQPLLLGKPISITPFLICQRTLIICVCGGGGGAPSPARPQRSWFHIGPGPPRTSCLTAPVQMSHTERARSPAQLQIPFPSLFRAASPKAEAARRPSNSNPGFHSAHQSVVLGDPPSSALFFCRRSAKTTGVSGRGVARPLALPGAKPAGAREALACGLYRSTRRPENRGRNSQKDAEHRKRPRWGPAPSARLGACCFVVAVSMETRGCETHFKTHTHTHKKKTTKKTMTELKVLGRVASVFGPVVNTLIFKLILLNSPG